jgi:multidrug efflux pump subunit AcrA (membrane-fusion protein)
MRKNLPSITIKKLCVYLCSTLFLFAACTQRTQNQVAATPTPLPTPVVPEQSRYTVQRGTVLNILEFTGRISPVTEEAIFFRSDGFVAQIHVAYGDIVQAGDLLAELNVTGLEGRLAQAELAVQRAETILASAEQSHEDAVAEAERALEQAQTRLQQVQAGAIDAGVTTAEVSLARAEEQVAYWQDEYQKALDRPWESQEVKDNYARQLREAEQNLEVAQAQYDAAVGNRSADYYTIQLQEYEVQAAELRLEQLQRGVDPLLALDVEKAHLDVTDLEAQLAQTQLIAPFDGIIVSLNIRAGNAITAYDVVAVVADPTKLEVTAELGVETLRELSVEMSATVRLRNQLGENFVGTIHQLPSAFSGSSIDNNSDSRVHVALDHEAIELELGVLADVTVVLQEKENALWLPPAAIRIFQGRNFVVVEKEDGQHRIDVRLGIKSERRVEIVEGVEEGQIIIGE